MDKEKTPGLAAFNVMLFGDERAELGMRFLRGHLVLEQGLTALVEARAAKAEVLLNRATFSRKLDLCEGLGWLPQHVVDAVRAVNRQRNRLAHGPSERLTGADIDTLVDSMSQAIRAGIAAAMRVRLGGDPEHKPISADEEDWSSTSEARLASLFLMLALILGGEVQKARYELEHRSKLQAFNLAVAMDEIEGKLRREAELRKRLDLPEPPDGRHALSVLFPDASRSV